MNNTQYQNLAFRTCKIHDSHEFNLLHMAVGIGSEYDELINAIDSNDKINIIEEIGDIMWYIACYKKLNNSRFDVIVYNSIHNTKPIIDYMNKLPKKISTLQNLIKRQAVYLKPDEAAINTNLEEIIKILLQILAVLEVDIYSVYIKNIDKLSVRYPEKYTDINAVNRDLFSELKALKKDESI